MSDWPTVWHGADPRDDELNQLPQSVRQPTPSAAKHAASDRIDIRRIIGDLRCLIVLAEIAELE